MLIHLPQVLSPSLVPSFQEALLQAHWHDGRITAGEQSAQVKNNWQLAETSPVLAQLRPLLLQALAENPVFFSAALPKHIFPPLFNAYQNGMHFGSHIDNAVRPLPAPAGQPLGHTDYVRTDLSATLFLADPASYDGGELVIEDLYGEHAVKLAAGDMVLYPATSLHRVQPVTRGLRLAAFFWMQSLVRDAHQRRILFEMDRAISSLRQNQGESAEVLSLTGCYHNLLRQWAEV